MSNSKKKFPVDVAGWFYRKQFSPSHIITVWGVGDKVEGREDWDSWHVRVVGELDADISHFMLPDEILAFGHGFQWGKLKVFIGGEEIETISGLTDVGHSRKGMRAVSTKIIRPLIVLVDRWGRWGEHSVGLLCMGNGFVQRAGSYPHLDKVSGWAFLSFEAFESKDCHYCRAAESARLILDNLPPEA